MTNYPKWVFSVKGKRLLQSYEEEQALGPGWYQSRAEMNAANPPQPKGAKAVPGAPAPAPAPAATVKLPEAVEQAARLADATLKKFYAAPAKIIIDQVSAMDNRDDLLELREIEENRPGGARKTVLSAVGVRLAAMEAAAAKAAETATEQA